jgi:hypothetical protein
MLSRESRLRLGMRFTRIKLRHQQYGGGHAGTRRDEMVKGDSEIVGSDLISVRDAYIAMFRFVDAYWKRGKRLDGSVTLLVDDMAAYADPKDPVDLSTSDPAFWSDWLEAVKAAKSGPPPEWFHPTQD